MIQERVRAGLKRARAQGKVLGRPKVSMEIEKRVRAIRAKGFGMIRIARELGIERERCSAFSLLTYTCFARQLLCWGARRVHIVHVGCRP